MNRRIPMAMALWLAAAHAAAGDAELGRAKSRPCADCHGQYGERELPLREGGVARLAGMEAKAFVDAVKAYRNEERFHPLMRHFVEATGEADMEDLIAYYTGPGGTLYHRLGGREAIGALVRELLAAAGRDARLEHRLSGRDLARCGRQFADLLCESSGGPCKYAGRDMKGAHAGLGITMAEWRAFNEVLAATLERLGLPAGERGEVLALLSRMKGAIVGR